MINSLSPIEAGRVCIFEFVLIVALLLACLKYSLAVRPTPPVSAVPAEPPITDGSKCHSRRRQTASWERRLDAMLGRTALAYSFDLMFQPWSPLLLCRHYTR